MRWEMRLMRLICWSSLTNFSSLPKNPSRRQNSRPIAYEITMKTMLRLNCVCIQYGLFIRLWCYECFAGQFDMNISNKWRFIHCVFDMCMKRENVTQSNQHSTDAHIACCMLYSHAQSFSPFCVSVNVWVLVYVCVCLIGMYAVDFPPKI